MVHGNRVGYSVQKGLPMSNGISKKLCVTIVGIQAVVKLSEGAANKLYYAAGVVIICIVFKLVQTWLDRKGQTKD